MNDEILLTPEERDVLYESNLDYEDNLVAWDEALCRAQVRKALKVHDDYAARVRERGCDGCDSPVACDLCIEWRFIAALRDAAGEGEDAPPTPISYPAQTELGKRLVDLRNKAAGEGK